MRKRESSYQVTNILAKIPGIPQDSIRNEGTQEIKYGII
jgi:hypothetical protein